MSDWRRFAVLTALCGLVAVAGLLLALYAEPLLRVALGRG